MKPFTIIAIVVFVLVSLFHLVMYRKYGILVLQELKTGYVKLIKRQPRAVRNAFSTLFAESKFLSLGKPRCLRFGVADGGSVATHLSAH